MRHPHIFLLVSIVISGALAGGYFFFGFGQDYVNSVAENAPVTGLQAGIDPYAMTFNPQNEMGMIVILGAMVVLSAIVILKSREIDDEEE